MAEKEFEPVTYLDIGFNPYGLNTLQSAQAIPANLADYMLEMSEASIGNKKIKNLAVTNGKIVSMSADKITAGTLAAITNVGDDSIVLDGENRVIKIYDASDNVSVYIAGGAA